MGITYLRVRSSFLRRVKGNTVTLAATSLSGTSNGDGTLATITFEIVAVKPSTLDIIRCAIDG